MIAMAAIAKIQHTIETQTGIMVFFFFDSDYSELTSATSALRALIWLLLEK
jgi:hypothetical protein